MKTNLILKKSKRFQNNVSRAIFPEAFPGQEVLNLALSTSQQNNSITYAFGLTCWLPARQPPACTQGQSKGTDSLGHFFFSVVGTLIGKAVNNRQQKWPRGQKSFKIFPGNKLFLWDLSTSTEGNTTRDRQNISLQPNHASVICAIQFCAFISCIFYAGTLYKYDRNCVFNFIFLSIYTLHSFLWTFVFQFHSSYSYSSSHSNHSRE